MSTHRLLSAAALRSGVAAAAIVPPAAAAPAPSAAAANAGEVDVVTMADATAAIAAAADAARAEGHTAGATAERERTNAVFASAEGQANPQMAAFMLSSAPGATSEAIVAQLKLAPAAATTAAPAPAAQAETPAAPAPLTHDLNLTPKVEPGADANQGGADAMTKDDQAKFWDSQVSAANASAHSPFGAEIAPGLPRTGN